MWKKLGGFMKEHVIGWVRELFTRPKTLAALIAGILLATGVPAPLAHQIATPVAAIVSAIEQSQGQGEPVDNLPPVAEGVPIVPNKTISARGN